MNIGAYVINLDRSVDRWENISSRARKHGVDLIRVSGVDASLIPADRRECLDVKRFSRLNGRLMLSGEYGCYRSHLKSLKLFLESDFDAAIVMEDDVDFGDDLIERSAVLLEALPGVNLVKLLNHRTRWFWRKTTTRYGDALGRCIHGPQGSTACYIITREGARKLLDSISTMSFPFDVALERSWHTGVDMLTVKSNMVSLGHLSQDTVIATRADYRRHKFRGPKRIVTHLFRAVDYARRVRYVVWKSLG